jgi:hypothetical protein
MQYHNSIPKCSIVMCRVARVRRQIFRYFTDQTLAFGGKSFIDAAVPGDVIDASVLERNKNFLGELAKLGSRLRR